MKLKTNHAGEPAIWIELERHPTDHERNRENARLASEMLRRLCPPEQLANLPRFTWGTDRYCYGTPMGWRELSEDGEWFDLAALAGEK